MQHEIISESITHHSVMALRGRLEAVIAASQAGLLLEISEVKFDSSILTLILCLKRKAQMHDKCFQLQVPKRVRQIAAVYGLEGIIASMIKSGEHG